MKKVISLVFAVSVIGSPSLAWGWGEGGCSYSKDKTNQETKTRFIIEESDQKSKRMWKTSWITNINKKKS